MAKPATMLLMPWGNGLGHLMRCLVLGRAALARGWRVVVTTAARPEHIALVRSSGCELRTYPADLMEADPWSPWLGHAYVKASILADSSAITDVQPTIVVHDGRYSTPVAARITRTPCVGLLQHVHYPGHVFPGSQGPSPFWTAPAEAVGAALSALGYGGLDSDVRNVFRTEAMFIASVPEFDPAPRHLGATPVHHVGPLTELSGPSPVGCGTDALRLQRRDSIFFYRTANDAGRADEFRSAFSDLGDRAMIATGEEAPAAVLRRAFAATAFVVRPLFNMEVVRRRAAVAVVHGGHGTCLTCLQAGLPAVVLPDHSPERADNASRLQQLGTAVRLGAAASNDGPASNRYRVADGVSWSEIRTAAERLASDPSTRRRAANWAATLSTYSVSKAMDMLVDIAARRQPATADAAWPLPAPHSSDH